jgi:intracellular sulfur oxidation DsrE/DsrF family protein
MAYRAVFELAEAASCKVDGILDNIRHLQAELGPAGLEVELVAHSDGIAALLRRPDGRAAAIEELAAQGVRFAACRTTMAGRGLTADDVLEVAQIVPSGVGELVRRQAEGWAYVHP